MSGVVTVVPAASEFAQSTNRLAGSVKDFAAYVSSLSNAATLNQNLDAIHNAFGNVIVAANSFSEAIHDNTDKYGNLNVLHLQHIVNTLNDVSQKQDALGAAIKEKIDGDPAGSSTDIDELASIIEKTSDAFKGFADVADHVHGITAFVFGTAADILSVVRNLEVFSESLLDLSDKISHLSDPSFDKLVKALNDLADTEHVVSESFARLNYLF